MRSVVTRRALVAAAVASVAGAAAWWHLGETRRREFAVATVPHHAPATQPGTAGMPLRRFGATQLSVSEVSFGAWGIGGAYGSVQQEDALRALAIAEEKGCNFVDTAAVYGDSEQLLGKFLGDRRSRWLVSTKYSGQPAGMSATLEEQLRRLGTDHVDLYLIHWVPGSDEAHLYDELAQLKQAGKVRHAGVSLYNTNDIDVVLRRADIDAVMLPMSLLDPDPFIARATALRAAGKGVLVRSSLREGFLVGGFDHTTRFTDPRDQRSQWSSARIAATVDNVEAFRFLERDNGSLLRAAVAYPLSFPEVSSVVLGARSPAQASENFGDIPGLRLSVENLRAIADVQQRLDLPMRPGVLQSLRQLLRA